MLHLTRSKVYYTPTKPAREQLEERERSMARIDYCHTAMPYIDTRKLVRLLQNEGINIGRKLMKRLMRDGHPDCISQKEPVETEL